MAHIPPSISAPNPLNQSELIGRLSSTLSSISTGDGAPRASLVGSLCSLVAAEASSGSDVPEWKKEIAVRRLSRKLSTGDVGRIGDDAQTAASGSAANTGALRKSEKT